MFGRSARFSSGIPVLKKKSGDTDKDKQLPVPFAKRPLTVLKTPTTSAPLNMKIESISLQITKVVQPAKLLVKSAQNIGIIEEFNNENLDNILKCESARDLDIKSRQTSGISRRLTAKARIEEARDAKRASIYSGAMRVARKVSNDDLLLSCTQMK
jgi:hypothetical protein